MKPPPSELTTADIARLRGVTRQAARNWLVDLEREHGPTVVGRRGRSLYTTHEALEKVCPGLSREHRFEPRMAKMHERMTALEFRHDALVREVQQLRDSLRVFQKSSTAFIRKAGESKNDKS